MWKTMFNHAAQPWPVTCLEQGPDIGGELVQHLQINLLRGNSLGLAEHSSPAVQAAHSSGLDLRLAMSWLILEIAQVFFSFGSLLERHRTFGRKALQQSSALAPLLKFHRIVRIV